MEFRNEPNIRLETRIVRIFMVSSLITVFLAATFFLIGNFSVNTEAFAAGPSTYTISGSFTSSQNITVFQNAIAGDTIKIASTVTLDQNSSDLQSKNIIILIDNGVLNWSGNYNLNLSSGAKLLLTNGGNISATGCNANPSIYFGGVKKVSCSGGGADLTFAQVNAAGGVQAGGTTALPVELIAFEVKQTENKVVLNWATASEFNNDFFEIQRSTEGENWIAIGIVKGQGNSNNVVKYTFMDQLLDEENMCYYRLNQVDFDGTSTLSFVRAISNNALSNKSSVSVYPNPADNFINLKMNEIGSFVISLSDKTGHICQQFKTNEQFFTLHTANLKNGSYFVNVQNDQINETHKVMVRH